MSYLHKLEAELELAQAEIRRLQDRESDWQNLLSGYRIALWKVQRGKRVDAEQWQFLNGLKNKLGIGNGILR